VFITSPGTLKIEETSGVGTCKGAAEGIDRIDAVDVGGVEIPVSVVAAAAGAVVVEDV
jgi:hypothetical protein